MELARKQGSVGKCDDKGKLINVTRNRGRWVNVINMAKEENGWRIKEVVKVGGKTSKSNDENCSGKVNEGKKEVEMEIKR